jgi:ribosome-binding protein aMBF1 (putative translation factor)
MTLKQLSQLLGVSARAITDAYMSLRSVDNDVARRMRELSNDTVHLLSRSGEITDKLADQHNTAMSAQAEKWGDDDYKTSAAIRKKQRVVPTYKEKFWRITDWDNHVSKYLRDHNMSITDLAIATQISHHVITRSYLGLVAAKNYEVSAMLDYTNGAIVLQQVVHTSLLDVRVALSNWMRSNVLDYNTLAKRLGTKESKIKSILYGRTTPHEKLIEDLIKISDGAVDLTKIGAKALMQRTICC